MGRIVCRIDHYHPARHIEQINELKPTLAILAEPRRR